MPEISEISDLEKEIRLEGFETVLEVWLALTPGERLKMPRKFADAMYGMVRFDD